MSGCPVRSNQGWLIKCHRRIHSGELWTLLGKNPCEPTHCEISVRESASIRASAVFPIIRCESVRASFANSRELSRTLAKLSRIICRESVANLSRTRSWTRCEPIREFALSIDVYLLQANVYVLNLNSLGKCRDTTSIFQWFFWGKCRDMTRHLDIVWACSVEIVWSSVVSTSFKVVKKTIWHRRSVKVAEVPAWRCSCEGTTIQNTSKYK